VGAEEAAIEQDGREEGHWFRSRAAGYARGRCEEAEGGTHFEGAVEGLVRLCWVVEVRDIDG
jgi:hypothetical protein